MKFPFVSRARHEAGLAARDQVVSDALDSADAWRRDALYLANRLQAEFVLRQKAEGELRWRDERIRRVLGLPGFELEEEKKSA